MGCPTPLPHLQAPLVCPLLVHSIAETFHGAFYLTRHFYFQHFKWFSLQSSYLCGIPILYKTLPSFIHLGVCIFEHIIISFSSLSGVSANSLSLDANSMELLLFEGVCVVLFLLLMLQHWDLCICY